MNASERGEGGRRLTSASATETERIGGEIAAGLAAGDVVVVGGDLGAGKTTLIRGACRALGVEEPIVSPTFTIGRRYTGRLRVSHLDLYRLSDIEVEEPALLDDYLDQETVAFVEWPAVARPRLEGRSSIAITLEHAGEDRRIIAISGAPTCK